MAAMSVKGRTRCATLSQVHCQCSATTRLHVTYVMLADVMLIPLRL
jgi:hypothetical protein